MTVYRWPGWNWPWSMRTFVSRENVLLYHSMGTGGMNFRLRRRSSMLQLSVKYRRTRCSAIFGSILEIVNLAPVALL